MPEPRLPSSPSRSEERFSRNAETDIVCRLLLENSLATKRGDLPPEARAAPLVVGARGPGRRARGARQALRLRAQTRRLAGRRRCRSHFFFNDRATTEIYPLSLPALFR